jgi:signal transduction histidine kinase
VTSTTAQLPRRITLPARVGTDARRRPNAVVFFTLVAVTTAFGLLALPSERRDYVEIWAAAPLGVALIALSLVSRRFPKFSPLAISLGYIALAALLRNAAGGSTSGFGGLLLLPVLWLALTTGVLELAIGLLAVLLAQVVPIVMVGAPWYPSSSSRAVVVFTTVAAIAGLMVNRLVIETQKRSALLQGQTVQLERQNEQLMELDRMKNEFIAVISHELRTPLTSISGYLDMALDVVDEPIPPTQRGQLLIVQRNVSRLVALVNQLLYLARAEAQPVTVSKQPTDLQHLLDDCADTARPAAEEKSIELRLETEPLPPVLADADELLRLLDNLVSNAIKFTPTGGQVLVQARRNGDRVLLEVTDTGPGIPLEEQRHLFKPFARTKFTKASAVPGTGLGLAISQRIAEAHETTIEVESTPGNRTTFRLSLTPYDRRRATGDSAESSVGAGRGAIP